MEALPLLLPSNWSNLDGAGLSRFRAVGGGDAADKGFLVLDQDLRGPVDRGPCAGMAALMSSLPADQRSRWPVATSRAP
jgi:hypothetical protein